MLNYFKGQIAQLGDTKYLINDFFGVQIQYEGNRNSGEFFLYSYIDDNTKTIKYFAFESNNQKVFFEKLIKLPGIGPKVAFHISSISVDKLQEAIENFDIKFFESLPGIGPKTAKRLIVELKNTIKNEDFEKVNINDKVFKDITTAVKSLGYDAKLIKKTLSKCPIQLNQENTSKIIKWLIENM